MSKYLNGLEKPDRCKCPCLPSRLEVFTKFCSDSRGIFFIEQSTVSSTRKDINKETFGYIDLLAEGDSRVSDCWFRVL